MTETAWLIEIRRLCLKHDLGFRHNPGGGEFSHDEHGRVQVQLMDDQEDYAVLMAWLRHVGLEP